MSDSTTPFGTITDSQGNQTSKANALFDASAPIVIYAKKLATTTGLTLGYHGGKISIGGTLTAIADGTIALTGSTTNYIEANPTTGVVTKNTAQYTPGYWRIGRAVTSTTLITTWYDDRYLNFALQTRRLTKTFPTDANYTASASEVDVDWIVINAGIITTTRNFIVPITSPKLWIITNNNTQSVYIVGPTGTGTTVGPASTIIVAADGTNVVQVTPFVGTSGTETKIITESTVSRTFSQNDANAWIRTTNSSVVTLTIPNNGAIEIPVTSAIEGVQASAGQVTIVADSGVTLNTPTGYSAKTRAKGSCWGLIKIATNEWDLVGDLEIIP